MRGLAHGSDELAYAGYRELYECGPGLVHALERRIFLADWEKVTRPVTTRMQMALISLLHDIDEPRSQEIIRRLLAGKCHAALRSALRFVSRFDSGNFGIHEICGLRVMVDKAMDPSEAVLLYLKRWLNTVPRGDLAGIERLYVIPHAAGREAAGHYMPILSTINVYWRNTVRTNRLRAWYRRAAMEFTLYHEIGHHVHRHTFGQQPEQEKEADRYAAARMRETHPVATAVARTIGRVLDRKKTSR